MREGQIFNAMIAFFEEDDWNFQWLEGMPVLSMGFTGRSGRWICYAQAREEQEQFVFYSVCPVNAPREKLAEIAEFLTRANYGMIIGNFELDYADGEIRYKTSIDVEGAQLLPALVKQMVYSNVMIMDRYLPGIMRVLYGDVDPAEAILELEDGGMNAFGEGSALDGYLEGLDDLDLDDDDLNDDDLDLDDYELLDGDDDDDDFDPDDLDLDDHDDDDLNGFGPPPPDTANLN
ncbi:MAG: YbjN domain-containing protein [bacterium]|nr:YbjN domain-containing protein [bacterium]